MTDKVNPRAMAPILLFFNSESIIKNSESDITCMIDAMSAAQTIHNSFRHVNDDQIHNVPNMVNIKEKHRLSSKICFERNTTKIGIKD